MKLRLKDFLSVQAKSKTKAGEGLAKGTYKFFTSSPIQSKFVDSWQYNAEALVFGTGGNASVHYVDDKFSTSTDCLVMTNRKPQEVNLKCVYYFLLGNLHLLAAGFKGCGLQHISKDFILDIGIDLPEKSIQDKIVTVCDLLAGMMSNQKKQLEMLDDLVKSQFIEVFGEYDLRNAQDAWERIGAVAEVVGGSTPKTGESEFWGGEHYWITPAEIADDDFIIHRTERTLTDLGVRSCSLKLLPRGTVLLRLERSQLRVSKCTATKDLRT